MCAGHVLCLSLAVTVANAQPAPLASASKVGLDTPVLVKWSSIPSGIYSILYTTNLSDWFTAEDNFPAQGTNTFWSDYGSEMASLLTGTHDVIP